MAAAHVQSAYASDYFGDTYHDVTFSSTIGAGNAVVGLVSWHTAVTLTGVTINGVAGTIIETIGSNPYAATFYFLNVASGQDTVRCTFSGDLAWNNYLEVVHECSGVATANALDVYDLVLDENPGSSADAVNTGNVTPTVAGCYLFGATITTISGTWTKGTGWTAFGANVATVASESLVQGAAAQVAATFGHSNGLAEFYVAIVALKPPAASGQFARPSSTIAAGGWTATGAASLHAAIGESVASDAEYIISGANPDNDTHTGALTGATGIPVAGTGTVNIRAGWL